MMNQQTPQTLKKRPARSEAKQAEGNGFVAGDNGRKANNLYTSIITSQAPDVQPSPMAKSALIYAQKLGFHVFPAHSVKDGRCTCNNPNCTAPGKAPYTRHGYKDATTDPQLIMQYWHKWPEANPAIRTGRESGASVLDVDLDGLPHLEELQDAYGPLPETPMALTGSGGRHYYFQYDPRFGTISSGKIAPGIDIRNDGGYAILPPARHISGGTYEWEWSQRILGEGSVPLKPAPEWLFKLIEQAGIRNGASGPVQARTASEWDRVLAGLKEGEGRNNAAAALAGHLLRRYTHPTIVHELLTIWNETRNQPPLEQHELETILNSIARKEIERRKRKEERRGAAW
ncbi:bifunctional DNA primase/polymerase [Bhargavaea beijingensis]|uniref:DNA primase n=1 Tax=Bhargavaea beijingensis TaxID=426756 RepID=A0ABX9ZC76_9BACL|nr:bifunctional DNA primase/polymerase [Bhargavaea beijingensis]RSK30975.1 DNA primase [Bhargavaea beijingensis]